MNYYEHHIGDYAEATGHLSFVEDAAYSRLIRKYYATEKPLPADVKQVQRLVAARTKEERAAVEQVLQEFFELREDGWHNRRCDRELARYLAGAPDREQKRSNKDTRMKRHRALRAALFDALREVGQHPAWDTRTDDLRVLLQRCGVNPETVAATAPVTPPATAPVTPATATQSPDTSPQYPEVSTPPASRVPPAGAGSPPERLLTARDLVDEGVVEQHAKDWLKVRKAKKAPLTVTAWEAVKREAAVAGITPAKAVQEAAERGWQGFKASWWQREQPGLQPGATKQDFAGCV